jgi:putative glycosyltransferase
MTGLSHATGDLVFLIDGDLEEPPENLAILHQRFARGDCDVVDAAQQ